MLSLIPVTGSQGTRAALLQGQREIGLSCEKGKALTIEQLNQIYYDTDTTINDIIAAINATQAIAITPQGLAVGGGDLTQNRIIDVPIATQAETQAMLDNTKAVTPYALQALMNALLPAGLIAQWGGATPPQGWLECNGQSSTGYAALQALYPSNIPDLRGIFMRGWDNGRGLDPARSMLSYQADDFKSHIHPLPTGMTGGFMGVGSTGGYATPGGGAGQLFGNGGTGAGGTETRPKNIAVMFIIKI
jgi:hypothetical protein